MFMYRNGNGYPFKIFPRGWPYLRYFGFCNIYFWLTREENYQAIVGNQYNLLYLGLCIYFHLIKPINYFSKRKIPLHSILFGVNCFENRKRNLPVQMEHDEVLN